MSGPPLSPSSTAESQTLGDLSTLRAYASSAKGTRYFCSTCGAHMFFKDEKRGEVVWEVMGGVLEHFDGIVKINKHIHVGDTLDGGVADDFVQVDGETLPRYFASAQNGEGKPVPLGWKDAFTIATSNIKLHEMLHFYCHCKSIDLYLQRPAKIMDSEKEWYLVPGSTPDTPIRYLTEYCFCTSCRLTSGSIVGTWTYVPMKDSGVFLSPYPSPESALDLTSNEPTRRPKALKQYISSPQVHREFCGTCGAKVFYWKDVEGRKFMDIATGLVDENQAGGVRANGWLHWGRIPDDGRAYEEDSTSHWLVASLKEGRKEQ